MCAGVVAVERREDEGRWGGIADKRVHGWKLLRSVDAIWSKPKFHGRRLCVSDVITPFSRAMFISAKRLNFQATLIIDSNVTP
jgi:hypothetical protein